MVMRNTYKPQTVINFENYKYYSSGDTESSSSQKETAIISKFNGENQDVEHWLLEYQIFSEKKGWDDFERKNLVELYLDGEAREVELSLDNCSQFEVSVSRRFRGDNLIAVVSNRHYQTEYALDNNQTTPSTEAESMTSSEYATPEQVLEQEHSQDKEQIALVESLGSLTTIDNGTELIDWNTLVANLTKPASSTNIIEHNSIDFSTACAKVPSSTTTESDWVRVPTNHSGSSTVSSGGRFECDDVSDFSQDRVMVPSSSTIVEPGWTPYNWASFVAYHSGLTDKKPYPFEIPPNDYSDKKISWSATTTPLMMVRKIKESPPSAEIADAFSLFCLKSACFMSKNLTFQYQDQKLTDCPFSDALDKYIKANFTVDGRLFYYQITLIGHLLLFRLPLGSFDFVDNFRKKLGVQSIFHADLRKNSFALTPTQTLDLQLQYRRCDVRNGRICASIMTHFLIMCTKNIPLPNIDYLDEETYELTVQQKSSLRVKK